MKKLYSIIVTLIILITLPVTAVANTASFVYKDNDTGVTFQVPDNWTKEALSKDREYIDVKFTSDIDAGVCILYGSTDVWAELSSSERAGLSRSDLNNSIFSLDEIAEAMDAAQGKVSKVTYGGSEYFEYVQENASSFRGFDYKTTITGLMRFENGYAYTFQFSGDKNDILYKYFESLLTSVTYPDNESTSTFEGFSKFSASNIILSLLITITIYSVPIIIYRYGVLKHPVESGKAKKITIIYGIIAFIAMSVLIFTINGSGTAGGAIILWSWVNYKVLVNGGEAQNGYSTHQENSTTDLSNDSQRLTVNDTGFIDMTDEQTTANEEQTFSEEKKFNFCHKCGTKLGENSRFCHKCGARIIK